MLLVLRRAISALEAYDKNVYNCTLLTFEIKLATRKEKYNDTCNKQSNPALKYFEGRAEPGV